MNATIGSARAPASNLTDRLAEPSPRPSQSRAWYRSVLSMRAAMHDEAWRRNWAMRFLRPGFLLIIVFEAGSIATSQYLYPDLFRRAFPFEIFNAVAAFTCLSLMWTARFEHHWRATAFSMCFIILLAASYLSLLTQRTEPLFVSVMLLLFGAGSLVPWSVGWQTALTLLCLSWLAINAIWLPPSDPDGLYRWLGLLAAAGLAQVGTARTQYQREQFESKMQMMLEGEKPQPIPLAARSDVHV